METRMARKLPTEITRAQLLTSGAEYDPSGQVVWK